MKAAVPTPPTGHVILIGPPGAGKTTIGRNLAHSLGWTFTDVDTLIESQTQRSISEIFIDEGEAAFRDLERQACATILRAPTGVISLGGGAILDPATEADLNGHTSIFLDVSIADAAGRVGFTASRPLLAVNPRAQWTTLMTHRRPIYQRIATHRIDTAGRTPEDILTEARHLLLTSPNPKPEQP